MNYPYYTIQSFLNAYMLTVYYSKDESYMIGIFKTYTAAKRERDLHINIPSTGQFIRSKSEVNP